MVWFGREWMDSEYLARGTLRLEVTGRSKRSMELVGVKRRRGCRG